MLDPHEKVNFDRIVTQLGAEDPAFLRRTGRLGRPRRRLQLTMAILLWTLAPACIVLGGWTGVLMAVVGVAYGAHLMAKRDRTADDPSRSSSSHRRPEASL